MAKSKLRILLTASVLTMLSVTLLAGGTYALFTSNTSVKNHLKAGNLNVSLLRTKYSKTVLDNDGYLVTKEDNETVDFTKANDKNIFGLEESELIVPTSKFSADLKMSNNGSVAFDYKITLDLDKTKSGSHLIDQLEITIKDSDGSYSKKLSECDNFAIYSGVMSTSDNAKEFKISLEFVNSDSNNEAKNEEAYFDLIVEATQKTSK